MCTGVKLKEKRCQSWLRANGISVWPWLLGLSLLLAPQLCYRGRETVYSAPPPAGIVRCRGKLLGLFIFGVCAQGIAGETCFLRLGWLGPFIPGLTGEARGRTPGG